MKIFEGTFDLKARDRQTFTISLLAVLAVCIPYVFFIQPMLERNGTASVWFTLIVVVLVIGYLLSYLYIIQKRFQKQKLEFVINGGSLCVMWGSKIYKSLRLPVMLETDTVMEIINRYTNKPALKLLLSDGKTKLSISEILAIKPADTNSLKIWQSEIISVNAGAVEVLTEATKKHTRSGQ